MIDVPEQITNAVAQKFCDSYPEFHLSAANAAKLSQAFEQLVDAGHPYSSDTLALAYNHLSAGGQFERAEPKVVELPEEEMRYARHIETLAEKADRMTDAELEKSLLSAGVWVPKRNGSMWRD